jgi:hypothetical protein
MQCAGLLARLAFGAAGPLQGDGSGSRELFFGSRPSEDGLETEGIGGKPSIESSLGVSLG